MRWRGRLRTPRSTVIWTVAIIKSSASASQTQDSAKPKEIWEWRAGRQNGKCGFRGGKSRQGTYIHYPRTGTKEPANRYHQSNWAFGIKFITGATIYWRRTQCNDNVDDMTTCARVYLSLRIYTKTPNKGRCCCATRRSREAIIVIISKRWRPSKEERKNIKCKWVQVSAQLGSLRRGCPLTLGKPQWCAQGAWVII